RLYRPPHGVFSLAGLRLARELGLVPLLWSKWGRDWERRATPESIAARATAGIQQGDVVLLHDADHYSAPGGWQRTAPATGPLAERIADEGLRLRATLAAADIRGRWPPSRASGSLAPHAPASSGRSSEPSRSSTVSSSARQLPCWRRRSGPLSSTPSPWSSS